MCLLLHLYFIELAKQRQEPYRDYFQVDLKQPLDLALPALVELICLSNCQQFAALQMKIYIEREREI